MQRWLITLSLLYCAGCATYTDQINKAHLAADTGNYETAIRELNGLLGVTSYEQIPDKWTAHRPLVALERAMLLQARQQYQWSARDLSAAETELEFLDLKQDTAGNIGKYIYNDSAEVYKIQPTERLAQNALNMLNYLAMDNLEGASVEARRFTVSREYLESLDNASHCIFGSYLAGFVFEKFGEPERALRYYEEAIDAGDLQALREPVLRLSGRGNYVGRKLQEYIDKLESSATDKAPDTASIDEPVGDILIVLALGRVPYKVPQRIPVGAAVGMAGLYISGNPDILAYSAFKVVVYPELVQRFNIFTNATITLDGQNRPVELLTDLGAEIVREYETIKPKIIAAALTRMIARAAAAEGMRAFAREKGGVTALIAALGTEAALLGLDKPDTRSWTFLPARIYVCRTRVSPGQHEIQVDLKGNSPQKRLIQVEVPPEGFVVVVISEPR